MTAAPLTILGAALAVCGLLGFVGGITWKLVRGVQWATRLIEQVEQQGKRLTRAENQIRQLERRNHR